MRAPEAWMARVAIPVQTVDLARAECLQVTPAAEYRRHSGLSLPHCFCVVGDVDARLERGRRPDLYTWYKTTVLAAYREYG